VNLGADLRIGALASSDLEAARALLSDPWDRVAEEKLFGSCPTPAVSTPFGAWEGARLVGVAVGAGRWLRLLVVDPDARGRGVGSALLEAVARAARSGGERRLRTGDQPGNYLTPGVDLSDEATLAWFARRGFSRVAENQNLRVPLGENPLVSEARASAAGYELRRAERGDAERERLLGWLGFAHPAAWVFEAARALDHDPPGMHVALAEGELCAFACHDGNNRGLGWFGPAATVEAHRGRGVGRALLVRCLLDIAAAGHREAVIAWIGPQPFYERSVGALAGPRFAVLERAL